MEQYRAHPLFPVLEYQSNNVQKNQQALNKMETSMTSLQTSVTSISDIQEELLTLLRDQQKKQFSLKAEGFDVNTLHSFSYTVLASKVFFL